MVVGRWVGLWFGGGSVVVVGGRGLGGGSLAVVV